MVIQLISVLLLIWPGSIIPTEGPLTLSEYNQPAAQVILSDTAELNRMIAEAWQLTKKKEKVQAMATIRDAMKFAAKNKMAVPYTLYWVYAETAFGMGDLGQAYEQSAKALTLLKSSKQYRQYAEVAILRSKIVTQFGKFSTALDLLQQTALLAKEKQLTGILPVVYRDMAGIYIMLEDSANEKRYTNLMLEASIAEKNIEYTARARYRLGEFSHRVDSNFRESNRQYLEALKIRQSMHDSVIVPTIMIRIGWNYYLLREYDSSMAWFNRCIRIGEKKRDFTSLANSYGNIGTIQRDLKDYSKALENYGRSTAYSLNTKDWFNLSWVYLDMSELYKSLGEYKNAYNSFMLYKQYSDSLKVLKYNSGLADARARYQAEAKDKEVELLALKLDKQKYFTFGFAGLIVLAIAIGILLFYQARLNNRRKISEMNRRIAEITQANLRQQMNPHFIFNTLNSIQYYMYQHDKIATNNYLTKFSILMRKTLENSQHTSIPIKDELDALQLYLELETLRFKEKFHYSIYVDEEIDTLICKIPTMLIQPYVENAISHGLINKEGKGYLKIDLRLKDGHIACIIEDDGIGREAAMEIKRNQNKNHNSLGTRITESRLNLVNTLYGTTMKVTCTDLKDDLDCPKGTRVEIQIPIMT